MWSCSAPGEVLGSLLKPVGAIATVSTSWESFLRVTLESEPCYLGSVFRAVMAVSANWESFLGLSLE